MSSSVSQLRTAGSSGLAPAKTNPAAGTNAAAGGQPAESQQQWVGRCLLEHSGPAEVHHHPDGSITLRLPGSLANSVADLSGTPGLGPNGGSASGMPPALGPTVITLTGASPALVTASDGRASVGAGVPRGASGRGASFSRTSSGGSTTSRNSNPLGAAFSLLLRPLHALGHVTSRIPGPWRRSAPALHGTGRHTFASSPHTSLSGSLIIEPGTGVLPVTAPVQAVLRRMDPSVVQAILQPSPLALMHNVPPFASGSQAPPSAAQMVQALVSTMGAHKEMTLQPLVFSGMCLALLGGWTALINALTHALDYGVERPEHLSAAGMSTLVADSMYKAAFMCISVTAGAVAGPTAVAAWAAAHLFQPGLLVLGFCEVRKWIHVWGVARQLRVGWVLRELARVLAGRYKQDLMTRLMAVLRWIIDQAEGNRAFTLRFVKRGGAALLTQVLSSPALAASEGPHKEFIVRAVAAVASLSEGREALIRADAHKALLASLPPKLVASGDIDTLPPTVSYSIAALTRLAAHSPDVRGLVASLERREPPSPVATTPTRQSAPAPGLPATSFDGSTAAAAGAPESGTSSASNSLRSSDSGVCADKPPSKTVEEESAPPAPSSGATAAAPVPVNSRSFMSRLLTRGGSTSTTSGAGTASAPGTAAPAPTPAVPSAATSMETNEDEEGGWVEAVGANSPVPPAAPADKPAPATAAAEAAATTKKTK